jgi:hypothetical protein
MLTDSKMIVYRDIITGDEMLSDAFPLKPVVDSDGNTVSYSFLFSSSWRFATKF